MNNDHLPASCFVGLNHSKLTITAAYKMMNLLVEYALLMEPGIKQ